MKVTAVIAEHNPFHNGHSFHLEESRRLTDADYVIAVMSGDYVQRGEPAVFNKYIRTKMALSQGVDAVFELPTIYALSSAELFAEGAVSLLNQLGAVDCLSFGSECGELNVFSVCADFLQKETSEYTALLSACLQNGQSFPSARSNALIGTSPSSALSNSLKLLLSSPNNTLGLEYCKQLLRLQSKILPFTIKRVDSSYHDMTLSESDTPFSSASAIRNAIFSDSASVQMHLPDNAFSILNNDFSVSTTHTLADYAVCTNDFSSILYYKLLSERDKGYTDYLDCNADLSNKIANQLHLYTDFEHFCMLLKSRNYTYARISRVLMHIVLNIRKSCFPSANCAGSNTLAPYARLLGFRKCSSEVLSEIKKKSSIPVIAKPADAAKLLDRQSFDLFQLDMTCADIYESVLQQKHNHFHHITSDVINSPIVM